MSTPEVTGKVWLERQELTAGSNRGRLCTPFRRDLIKFWADHMAEHHMPRVKADTALGYTVDVFGNGFMSAVTGGALVFPVKVKLMPLYQAKMLSDVSYKPKDPLIMAIGKASESVLPPDGHNEYEIGVKLSDSYRYPTFPYYPEDQTFLAGPNYEKVADAMIETCYRHELIAGAAKKQNGPHKVWEIYFMDNSIMRLSDMQTMLVLQGMLKGFKRLVEVDEDIRPALEEKLEIKRQNTWRATPGEILPKTTPGVPPSIPRKTPGRRATPAKPKSKNGLNAAEQALLDSIMSQAGAKAPEVDLDIDDLVSKPAQPTKSAFDDDELDALLNM